MNKKIVYKKYKIDLRHNTYFQKILNRKYFNIPIGFTEESLNFVKPKLYYKIFSIKIPDGITSKEYIEKIYKREIIFTETTDGQILLHCHGEYDGYIYINKKKYTSEDIARIYPQYKKVLILCCWGKYIKPYKKNGYDIKPLKISEPLIVMLCDYNNQGYIIAKTITYQVLEDICNYIKIKELETQK